MVLNGKDVTAQLAKIKELQAELAALKVDLPSEAIEAAQLSARQAWIDFRTGEYEQIITDANARLESLAADVRATGARVPRRDEEGNYHANPSADRPTQGEQSAVSEGNDVTTKPKRGRKAKGEQQAEATA